MWVEAAVDDYVNPPAQKLLQVLPQADVVEQAPARFQIDEQIDITVRAGIAASDGAEDTVAVVIGWVAHGFSRGGRESRRPGCHGDRRCSGEPFMSPTAKAMGHPFL